MAWQAFSRRVLYFVNIRSGQTSRDMRRHQYFTNERAVLKSAVLTGLFLYFSNGNSLRRLPGCPALTGTTPLFFRREATCYVAFIRSDLSR